MVALTLVTGLAYPLVIWGISRVRADSADGGLVHDGECLVASRGMADGREDLFRSRPEGMSNLSPKNPDQVEARAERRAEIADREGVREDQVPEDAVTGSGSGVDDGISVAYAQIQVARVARETGRTPEDVRRLIDQATEGRGLGFLGEPVVHVTELNLLLTDGACPQA